MSLTLATRKPPGGAPRATPQWAPASCGRPPLRICDSMISQAGVHVHPCRGAQAASLPAPRRLSVQALLQGARSREFRAVARCDRDRLAGRGIAPLARCALADAELPEPGERHLLATGKLV